MCGRFAMNKETNELIEEFVAAGGDWRDWRPGWNIKPTQEIPIVVESTKTGELVRRLEPARWSLVPSWSKTLKLKFPTFNARSEGIAEKATWRGPLKSHRCLVPMTGYYEWRTDPDGTKTPHFIHLPGETLAMAGLYSWWPDPALPQDDPARWNLTATILTADAVDELIGIHDRNPVPLPRDWWDDWLNPELEGDQSFVDAAVQAALPVAQSLEFYEVAPLRGDGPELLEPVRS
ncbi:putative SOS response-associated peptidase YedK [Homoserinimonas aerilata]|uniref:Abasic site processing protein n=2 Tax=Homoserinimonas aerilata TaxID=1162970 RepID=A0A542YF12_9MICO|nr:SOS response-associated peptidase [Homoserinimonas aerilata]TQL46662.1 putative SOS response-associated peptidase YedK [Homoserinimonas aerilata]